MHSEFKNQSDNESTQSKRKNEDQNTECKKIKLQRQIPKEIFLNIFECLGPRNLFNVFLVNKCFHEFANDEYLWKQFCKNILKRECKLFKTWKAQYIYCMKFHKELFTFVITDRTKFPMIRCGEDYCLILIKNGTLYSKGDNTYGQLCLKDNKNRYIFHKVLFNKKIIQISAGYGHTLVLTDDFHVYSCGLNEYGQLGLNDTIDRNELEWISSLNEKKIIQIECGDYHSCALTDKGIVYSWGRNVDGQLGHGDTDNRCTPTLINGLYNIKKIFCGQSHSMAINENSEIFAWGENENGQFGLGDNSKRVKPTLNSFFKNKKIIKMACGFDHCLVLLANGEIYSWGYNEYGQLGHGDSHNRYIPTLLSFFKGMNVMEIFAFCNQSFVLLENYDIYAIGNNDNGQLALHDKSDTRIPEKVTFFGNEKIVNIEGGYCHSFFITEDHKIFGVGDIGFDPGNAAQIPELKLQV